ncbi:MAG: 2-oxoacid:acceptor oxidoreductase subunit alpha [Candidatus Aenigmarchaeota archaeon]|nr:2-oxoacid:acceptor oxidoreductase subunit alpha [Candidatus Aenigmarchaeota archaeon]
MKVVNDFSWKIAGVAGDGILNAGLMLARCCMRGGLNVFASAEYPSLIRGGHNHLDVRVSEKPTYSHTKHLSLLVALNMDSVRKHAKKLLPGGGIIYDGDQLKLMEQDVGRSDIKLYPVPLLALAEQAGGKIMRNVVAMGATIGLTGFDIELFNEILRFNFGGKKGEAVVQANILAARFGCDYIREHYCRSGDDKPGGYKSVDNIDGRYSIDGGHPGDGFGFRLERREGNGHIFLSGNEAIVAGAIKAGCKFFAAYPMTPASSILHGMAANEKAFDMVVKHTEDEIAAINMAIGASFAGVRAMTATSGGGFALMAEGFGLAAQTETPIVVVEAQRPGPATGMATHSGQGDLRFVLHASTDEFPRIVIAPGDVTDCFFKTVHAFNLAEKYQLPVVVMTDKYLGESYASVEEFGHRGLKMERGKFIPDGELANNGHEYRRYKITEDGVSPRAVPGQKGGMHTASSYEHDEEGFEREEEETRIAMHHKRFRKLETASKEIPEPEIYGPAKADVTILSWGSPKGPIKEAMKLLQKDGIAANYLQIMYLSPFPAKKVAETIKKAKRCVIVESNMTSMLNSLVREHCLLDVRDKVLRYDGRPFNPEDIYQSIKAMVAG